MARGEPKTVELHLAGLDPEVADLIRALVNPVDDLRPLAARRRAPPRVRREGGGRGGRPAGGEAAQAVGRPRMGRQEPMIVRGGAE